MLFLAFYLHIINDAFCIENPIKSLLFASRATRFYIKAAGSRESFFGDALLFMKSGCRSHIQQQSQSVDIAQRRKKKKKTYNRQIASHSIHQRTRLKERVVRLDSCTRRSYIRDRQRFFVWPPHACQPSRELSPFDGRVLKQHKSKASGCHWHV